MVSTLYSHTGPLVLYFPCGTLYSPRYEHSLLVGIIIPGLEQNAYTIDEGDGLLTVCVNISDSFERNIIISVSTVNMSAEGWSYD